MKVPDKVAPAGAVHQGRRVALVIGNSAYRNVVALPNPEHDAKKVAATLRAIGFESVTLANDMTREKLIDALRTSPTGWTRPTGRWSITPATAWR